MATFTKIFFDTIANWEGGFQCSPDDAGNYDTLHRLIGTNRGIAAQTLQTYYLQFKGIDLTTYNIEDFQNVLKALTYDDAYIIAKSLFWDAVNGDEFANQSIAEIIFDWFWASFNFGIQWCQGCLATLGIKVQVDATLTKSEVDLINAYPDQEGLFNFIKSERLKFTSYLCQKYPQDEQWHIGWDRRINSYTFQA